MPMRRPSLKWGLVFAALVALFCFCHSVRNLAAAASFQQFIYIGVLSAPNNFKRREQARRLWLKDTRAKFGQEARVRAEFIVGHTPLYSDPHVQGVLAPETALQTERQLDEESKLYNDIRRIPLAETYLTLPDKSLQTLQLGVTAGYRYIVKIDDDRELHLPELMSFCSRMIRVDDVYAGDSMFKEKAYEIQLGADGQFVPYFGGPAYLLSHGLAAKVVKLTSKGASFLLTGSSSEDVDMGRWVEEAKHLGANVQFKTLRLSEGIPEGDVEGATPTVYSLVHGVGSIFCYDGLIREATTSGISDCQSQCGAENQCAYFSIWLTGGANWCVLTSACGVTGEQTQHSIEVYQKATWKSRRRRRKTFGNLTEAGRRRRGHPPQHGNLTEGDVDAPHESAVNLSEGAVHISPRAENRSSVVGTKHLMV